MYKRQVLRAPVRDDYGICRLLGPDDAIGNYIKQKYDPVVDDETGIPTKEGAMDREKEKGQYYNYYSIKEKTFVFQRYKTEKLYNQRRYKLAELKAPFGNGVELARVIADSYKRYPRKWLIAKASNGAAVREGKLTKPRAKAKLPTAPTTEETTVEPEPKGVFADMLKRTKDITKLKNPSMKGKAPLGVNMFRHAKISDLWRRVKIDSKQKKILAEMMLHSVKQAENYNFLIDESA